MTRGILLLVLAAGEPTFDHTSWARVLAGFVHGGRVDYAALARARGDLDAYRALIGKAQASTLPPKEQLAFWINAYNACVVAGVLASWPLRSVREAPQFFRRPRCEIAGKKRSLDELVQDIIRPTFKDARALLALAPGTRGGPRLRGAPYAGAQLDDALDAAARAYLTSPAGAQVRGSVLRLSALFNWYGDDFVRAAGTVPAFVARYRKVPAKARIEYIDYDWSLNVRD